MGIRRQAILALSYELLESWLLKADITLSSGEKLPEDITVLATHQSTEFGSNWFEVLLESPKFEVVLEGMPVPKI